MGCFWCFLNFKMRVWGVSCLIGLGSLVPAFSFRPTDPPAHCWARGGPFCLFVFSVLPTTSHSVLGHGLSNRAAKLRHGTVVFSCWFLFSSCRSPPQFGAGGAAKVIWLLILWHRTVCFCRVVYLMHGVLFSLCYTISARRFPPSRDYGLCHLSIFVLFFAISSHPPVTMAAGGRVLMLVCLAITPFSSRPPRHAGGTRVFF